MITDESVIKYLRDNIDIKREKLLSEMEEYALLNHIPIIQKEASDVLLFLIKLTKPKRILELGTAMGYSSILMALTSPDSYIDTLERNREMVLLARNYINKYSLDSQIIVHEGEINETIEKLDGKYDLVFIDAGKSHYSQYFQFASEHLEENGVIICDNVLINGEVAKDEIKDKKHATSILKMKKFISDISGDKRIDSVIIPVGDGLMIIKRKDN
ncbi:MAG: O-methyltransferase [Clostridiaceae bacterium]